MNRPGSIPLTVVDGLTLGSEAREALRPGETMLERNDRARRLPRFFYEVPDWDTALSLQLTEHFALWEFLNVDVREDPAMRSFPRYVPCAVTLLAAHLELIRRAVGTYVHIAANGGYRSPAHQLCRQATTHAWATAANIYRIGDDWLEDRETIEKYGRLARSLLPGLWIRPYGPGIGFADDHLHLDLGFVTAVPHEAAGEDG